MIPEKRRLGFDAFLPLALSLLFAFSILAGIVVYAVTLLPGPAFYALIAGGLTGEMILAAIYRHRIAGLMKQRRTLEKANLWFFVGISLAILFMVNLLSSRLRIRMDTTEDNQWTLSAGTIDVLTHLDRKVSIMTFFDEDDWVRRRGIDLLNEYALRQNLVEVIHHDTSIASSMAQKHDVEARTILVSCEDKKIKIFDPSESKITAAITRVTRDTVKRIAFTVGHGELRIDNHRRRGLSDAARLVRTAGYVVEELSITSSGAVPAGVDAVVIMGPRVPFMPDESEAVRSYLEKGGCVLLALDPESPNDFLWLEKDFGISCMDGIIVDPASHLMKDVTTPLIGRFFAHPATESITQVFFPGCRAFKLVKKHASIDSRPIADTSMSSWLEKDVNAQTLAFDPGMDVKGPLNIGYFVRNTSDVSSRLVLIGDSDFPTNGFQDSAGNRNLFTTLVTWLVKDEESLKLAATARTAETDKLNLSNFTLKAVFLTTTAGIPGVLIIAGTVIWLRRN